MAFDLNALRDAVERHRRVTRVVVAEVRGSCPREVGAEMFVWETGQSGTIGGGALEYELARAARGQTVPSRMTKHALGPDMNQCCGGTVQILSEVYDAPRLASLSGPVITRPISGGTEMPLSVRRLLAAARNQGTLPEPRLVDGWMIEPVAQPTRQFWVWGAGHVGRAIVHTLAPLPDTSITWIDTAQERFPKELATGVTAIPAAHPAVLVRRAPPEAEHLILTYSHALDLELCHQLLSHGFRRAGLIGSKTKWSRFRRRLAALDHAPSQIERIECPIGDPSLGKHPQAIAVGVVGALLRAERRPERQQETNA